MSNITRPDISVYQHTIQVAKEVYQLTCTLPVQQRFVLTSQLRRSIILICNSLANISASDSKLAIKRNSEQFICVYAEIKTQLKISLTLGNFTATELFDLEQSLDTIRQLCEGNLQAYTRN
jgi:four helix bundle protein